MTNEEYLREIEQFITQLKQYREESKTLATGMIGENFTQDTMTSIFISSLNCPSCGEASSFERYDRVDVSKTPQFRTDIIDWELFKFTCNHCGYQVIIDYPIQRVISISV